ncbi:MAG: UvrB/UvrC motif-containing protein, partial [Nitrospinaceae bacterium]
LDLPEVSWIAILDADKEGFLRSATSLIQTAGRAARNLAGTAILYADTITAAIQKAIGETERRRKIQLAYNRRHNIQPESIKKSIQEALGRTEPEPPVLMVQEEEEEYLAGGNIIALTQRLEKQMYAQAKNLEFEKAAALRDRIRKLKERDLGVIDGIQRR